MHSVTRPFKLSRRQMLKAGAAAACAAAPPADADAPQAVASAPSAPPPDTYENHARGIRILPGSWRPHYPWEQIAWVSPPWPSQDYVWLDFPEAIFTGQGLLYLSHVNPTVEPVVFPNPPAVPWKRLADGLSFERALPNGIAFGGSITRAEHGVDLELFIRNGSRAPLTHIVLQTCCFLRAISEFGAYSGDNKYVHVHGRGWMRFEEARGLPDGTGTYRLGWRGGPAVADRPIMVTRSAQADRLVACTWRADTYSLMQNPPRPCMHADPRFPDLEPGESKTIHGKLVFFEGSPADLDRAMREGRSGLEGGGR